MLIGDHISMIQMVLGQFPDLHFPDGHFSDGQLPEGQFPERTNPQTDISSTDSSSTDISLNHIFNFKNKKVIDMNLNDHHTRKEICPF